MEFIFGVFVGAAFVLVLGKAGWFEPRAQVTPERRFKYYYVCPIETCDFSVDSNVEAATEVVAKSHEETHER